MSDELAQKVFLFEAELLKFFINKKSQFILIETFESYPDLDKRESTRVRYDSTLGTSYNITGLI